MLTDWRHLALGTVTLSSLLSLSPLPLSDEAFEILISLLPSSNPWRHKMVRVPNSCWKQPDGPCTTTTWTLWPKPAKLKTPTLSEPTAKILKQGTDNLKYDIVCAWGNTRWKPLFWNAGSKILPLWTINNLIKKLSSFKLIGSQRKRRKRWNKDRLVGKS